MELKKVIALTTATIALVGTGSVIVHAGSYGDSSVSWSWGYPNISIGGVSSSSATSTFLNRVAPPTTSVTYGTKTNSQTMGAMQTAYAHIDFSGAVITSGATFKATSSNFNRTQ